MKFLLPLIALLATFFPVPTSGVIYVGVFYNLALKSTLRSLFYSTNVLGTADNSAKVPAYDHITIYFNPSQDLLTNQYNARFGAIQTAHILGYAMDEHGQALLVSVDGPNAIQSDNAFPHVTISSSGSPGYSAVYSNDLWARIAASGFVTITNDTYGKPASIKWNLKNPAVKPNLIVNNTYQFTLPAYTGITKYNSTLAKVQLFQPSLGGILKGTFCASSQWNGQTGVCNTTAIGPVATTKPTVPPSGDFRTLSFQLTLNLRRAQSDAETVLYLANAMREVGDLAGIPRSHYIINNADIKRISGQVNSKDGKWQIKIGFRVLPNVYQDERQIFIKQLKICFNPTAVTFDIAAASTISAKGLLIDDADTESFIEANEVYEIQTCADGTTLSADEQCSAVTSTETTIITSSSSSIPIATIVGSIIGGIVLIALIATVIIVRRRRPNAIKSMEGIARNTAALELNPPVTMTVTGTERV